MKLYTYFRSSASFRVRIALALKGLDFEAIPINLRSAEQKTSDYRAINPQGFVPALEDRGQVIAQSLAIMEYLDEAYPNKPLLLPQDIQKRATVRALVQLIACEIHPLNNLRVLKYLTDTLGLSEKVMTDWCAHWIDEGFTVLEKELEKHMGHYAYGDTPTLVDCFLVPQVFNAKRIDMDLSVYPNITRVVDNCMKLDAFIQASPANQVDAI